jgi:hypothetical protein
MNVRLSEEAVESGFVLPIAGYFRVGYLADDQAVVERPVLKRLLRRLRPWLVRVNERQKYV